MKDHFIYSLLLAACAYYQAWVALIASTIITASATGIYLYALTKKEAAMTEARIFLSRSEFAERIGDKMDTLARYKLPDPDAIIGASGK